MCVYGRIYEELLLLGMCAGVCVYQVCMQRVCVQES